MDKINNNGAQEPHQDVQNGGKDESSNSIGHEDYHPILIGEWNLPHVSLGIRIFILIFIGEKIVPNSHWFMKDEGAIDWREGFPNFHWTRRASSKKVKGVYQGGRGRSCVWWKKKEEEGKDKKDINVYVGKGVVHEKKNMCKQEHGRKLCVAST
jgi:hypothetical protein